MIPKTIYYTWFGRNELPSSVKTNIESWARTNPDYKIVQVDETRTDLFNYSDYTFSKEAYNAGKWAFVSDIARLHLIYEHGGIYLDTDVELLRPLDSLLHFSEIWARENRHTINSGLFFAAKPKSSNIKNILRIYTEKNFTVDELKKISTVSIISKYFWEQGLTLDNKEVSMIGKTAVLPTNYFAPIHYWGGGKINKSSLAVHKYNASWLSNGLGGVSFARIVSRWFFNQSILHSKSFATIVAKAKYR